DPSAPFPAGNTGSRALREFDRSPQSPDRAIPPSWVTILRPRLNWTQSLHFERNARTAERGVLSPAAAEEAVCIAEDLLTDEWIRVGAHHDRSGVAAGRPTDHIAQRGVPVHRRAVGVLREGGGLPAVLRPGIGGRGEERSKAQNRSKQSNRE